MLGFDNYALLLGEDGFSIKFACFHSMVAKNKPYIVVAKTNLQYDEILGKTQRRAEGATGHTNISLSKIFRPVNIIFAELFTYERAYRLNF